MLERTKDMQVTHEVTPEILDKLGLTTDEYDRILRVLGREPNLTELGVFSVMYSEHCSYKNSKAVLKLLPTTGKRVLIGAGEENAGVIDIGDGWCISFKIESHNHPSAVEPHQGAATGVGGILRDIFTMGARPVLLMNSLSFCHCHCQPSFGQIMRGFEELLFGAFKQNFIKTKRTLPAAKPKGQATPCFTSGRRPDVTVSAVRVLHPKKSPKNLMRTGPPFKSVTVAYPLYANP